MSTARGVLNIVDVVMVTADCGRITCDEIGYDLYEINLFINVSADRYINVGVTCICPSLIILTLSTKPKTPSRYKTNKKHVQEDP